MAETVRARERDTDNRGKERELKLIEGKKSFKTDIQIENILRKRIKKEREKRECEDARKGKRNTYRGRWSESKREAESYMYRIHVSRRHNESK